MDKDWPDWCGLFLISAFMNNVRSSMCLAFLSYAIVLGYIISMQFRADLKLTPLGIALIVSGKSWFTCQETCTSQVHGSAWSPLVPLFFKFILWTLCDIIMYQCPSPKYSYTNMSLFISIHTRNHFSCINVFFWIKQIFKNNETQVFPVIRSK